MVPPALGRAGDGEKAFLPDGKLAPGVKGAERIWVVSGWEEAKRKIISSCDRAVGRAEIRSVLKVRSIGSIVRRLHGPPLTGWTPSQMCCRC